MKTETLTMAKRKTKAELEARIYELESRERALLDTIQRLAQTPAPAAPPMPYLPPLPQPPWMLPPADRFFIGDPPVYSPPNIFQPVIPTVTTCGPYTPAVGSFQVH